MSEILNRPTLVLNRHWQPVGVAPVSRAIVMLWNGVVLVVEPDDFSVHSWHDWSRLAPEPGAPSVRAARVRLRVPEVVCLCRYDRLPGHLGDVQPAQRRQARPPHLPVLRLRSRAGSRSPSTTWCPARTVVRRAGPTAWPPACSATLARPTGPRKRPACTSASDPPAPTGGPITPPAARACGAGLDSSRTSQPSRRADGSISTLRPGHSRPGPLIS